MQLLNGCIAKWLRPSSLFWKIRIWECQCNISIFATKPRQHEWMHFIADWCRWPCYPDWNTLIDQRWYGYRHIRLLWFSASQIIHYQHSAHAEWTCGQDSVSSWTAFARTPPRYLFPGELLRNLWTSPSRTCQRTQTKIAIFCLLTFSMTFCQWKWQYLPVPREALT